MANCNHFPAKRFHTAGPQKSLFIPGPLLHVGLNEIVVFDSYGGEQVWTWSNLENPGEKLDLPQVARFTDRPSLGDPVESKPGQ